MPSSSAFGCDPSASPSVAPLRPSTTNAAPYNGLRQTVARHAWCLIIRHHDLSFDLSRSNEHDNNRSIDAGERPPPARSRARGLRSETGDVSRSNASSNNRSIDEGERPPPYPLARSVVRSETDVRMSEHIHTRPTLKTGRNRPGGPSSVTRWSCHICRLLTPSARTRLVGATIAESAAHVLRNWSTCGEPREVNDLYTMARCGDAVRRGRAVTRESAVHVVWKLNLCVNK